MLHMSFYYGLLGLLAIALLFAAVTDLQRREIDNWLNLAIALAAPAFWWVGRRGRTLAGEAAQLPTARNIDRRLVAGSLLFGIGWGLAGICPGPGIVATALGSGQAAVFVIAMAAGMLAWRLWQRPRA